MTDKQIIVNGVDVSGCKFAEISKMVRPNQEKPSVKCKILKDLNQIFHCTCQYNKNCYYKQLKRKEQECERLKEDYQKQLHKNIEKQCRINELQGIVSTKEFILKVNGKKYTNLSGIDKARLFINNENGVRK